jgi:hypothetical protein
MENARRLVYKKVSGQTSHRREKMETQADYRTITFLRLVRLGLLGLLLCGACALEQEHSLVQPRPVAPATMPMAFDPSVTVPYLASDALEGRGIGTHGLDVAAEYLAEHFRDAGLRRLPGMADYFQAFDYTARSTPAGDCALVVNGKALKLDEDYRPLTLSGEGAFDGEVVYAGYGITSKTRRNGFIYDDYASIDVKGKVVLIKWFEPMDGAGKSLWAPPGKDWSDEAGLENKIRNAREHGAVALLLFTPAGLEESDPLMPFGRQATVSDEIPAYQVKQSVAETLLAKGDVRAGNDGRPNRASGRVHIERTVVHVKNIVGMVPGVGPRAGEYVIVGAHYDHLGRGRFGGMMGRPGAIYHGADDNASGTAAVVDMAWHAANGPPRTRTVVFCLFTAEEEGLIGSAYFAAHPPIDLRKVAAMFNMDMVGRVKANTVYVGGEATARDIEAIAQTADAATGITLRPLPVSVGGRGGLGPSDHMEFALKGIPILFLYSGMHADYHRPTDTSDKINYAGIRQVVNLGDRMIDGLAAMPREPYDSSADIAGMVFPSDPNADHLSGAALGVVLDLTDDTDQPGALIADVAPGTAAQKAGIKAGDSILQFNDKKIVGMQDLYFALAMARPGDKVTLTVRRGKQTVLLQATLDEKR